MNAVLRLGCRAFQFGFKLAIPVLPYRDPEIVRHVGDGLP